MALGVGEHRDGGPFRHLRGLHHRAAPQTLDLAQRRLQVGYLNVEGDVPCAALHSCADTAVDATLTARVRHRVVRNRLLYLPVKRVLVEALKRLRVR
jgi:hypothetical protein